MAQLYTTPFGFRWGAALVERISAIRWRTKEDGEHLVLGVTTDAGVKVEVYISPSGRSVRVFKSRGGKNGVMRELK